MSIGDAVPWVHAYEVAKELAAELEPIVARSKAVGSLRRRQPTVGDIEFLVEPRTAGTDLFGEPGAPDIEAIHRLADTWGEVTVAGERQVRVLDVKGSGIKCELYLVHPPANWWCLLAIRTGPAELGKMAVTLMREHGLRHEDGRILREDGTEYPVESEEEFFAAAGLLYRPASQRDQAPQLAD